MTVTVAGLPAAIEYASPEQVLFLIPPGLKSGAVSVRLAVAGLAGPKLTIPIQSVAPAFYRLKEQMVMARHEETMEFVSAESPARPGERVILYAGGLGATSPAQKMLAMPRTEAAVKQRQDLRILLNGSDLPGERVGYAGISPGYPGFYEVRLTLPEELGDDPALRVCMGLECSPEGTILRTTGPPGELTPVQPGEEPPRSDN